MATFAYTAINAEGLEFDGTLTAADVAAAADLLGQRGLLADKLHELESEPTQNETMGDLKGV